MKFARNLILVGVLLLGFFEQSQATVLVNPPPPYFQHVITDSGYSIYYGGSTTGRPVPPAFFNHDAGFRFLNINAIDDPNLIYLDVSSNSAFTLTGAQHVVVTLFTTAATGNEIPLHGASLAIGTDAPAPCGTVGNCQGSRSTYVNNLSAVYTPGTVLRLSFSLFDLCFTPSVSTGVANFCTGTAVNPLSNTALTQAIVAVFSIVDNTFAAPGPASGAGTDTLTFTLNVSDIPPTIQCPIFNGAVSTRPEDFYFPGDGQAIINANNYLPGSGGTTISGAPLDSLVLFASLAATPVLSGDGLITTPRADVGGMISFNGSAEKVNGFANSTGLDNIYNAAIYTQNQVGIFSATSCSTADSAAFKIQTQPVSGVLTESKCFIATAAYHDGRAAPVMMLREFRDEVLTKFYLGRKFIETYYAYSPALAEWSWDKPLVRSFTLRALAPVELMAWAILKLSQAADESSQPYIDKLKKKLDSNDVEMPQKVESYSESEKRKLSPTPTPSSYIESLKSKIPDAEGISGYAEDEKNKLPEEKERESPIQLVKEKRDHYPIPDRPEIKNAVGFRFGVSPGFKVNNTAGIVTFAEIYGGGWQPDLWFHFERQLFHSENFGSFGLGVDMGLSYAEAFGRLTFPFGTAQTTTSQTKFSFLQSPLVFDAYYRFNLLRILRPYVGVGAGTMLYTEVRQDEQHDKRGYAFIYTGSAGVSLLLDFLDSATSLDSYLSSGMQHTYLFAEFTTLNTFSKTGVTFERNGIYSGFLFEY